MTEPSELTLEDIDKIAIMDEFRPTEVAIRLGLICSFYISHPQDSDVRIRLAKCGDMYQDLFGKYLNLYIRPDGEGNFTKYPAKGIPLLEYIEEHNNPEMAFGPAMTGATDYHEASSHSLNILASGTEFSCIIDKQAYFSATLPFSMINEQKHKAAFQNLVHDWCKILKPDSGYAGIGAIQSVDMMSKVRTCGQVYSLAKRFPGLDVDNPGIISNEMGDGIKGANWMTALSDSCLNRLGGRDAFLSQLDSNFHILEYEGGVLIQAGPTPQLGDRNRQQIPQYYRKMSQMVKPIRMSFPADEGIIQSLNGGDLSEVSNEWLARFDD